MNILINILEYKSKAGQEKIHAHVTLRIHYTHRQVTHKWKRCFGQVHCQGPTLDRLMTECRLLPCFAVCTARSQIDKSILSGYNSVAKHRQRKPIRLFHLLLSKTLLLLPFNRFRPLTDKDAAGGVKRRNPPGVCFYS